jgi:hypothetical protein
VAARLGLTEIAEAKKAKRKRRADPKPNGAVKSERNGKKKRQKKHDKKQDKKHRKQPKDADIPLCPLNCEESGKKCCDDGSCVVIELCCPGQRMCADGGCQPKTECCDDERKCPDGSCAIIGECCPGLHLCYAGGPCFPGNVCCPNDPQPTCGQCEHLGCENGGWVCQPITEQCGPGGHWNPGRCRCEYCEEICNGTTHMCQSLDCQDGERCVEGTCTETCTDPRMPQLCCVEDPPGQIRCTCRGANEVCYSCGAICSCIPGQTCCPPDHRSFCPRECLVAPCV